MNKIFKYLAVTMAGAGLAFSVFAQTPTPTPSVRTQVKEMTEMRKEGMEDINSMRQATREEMGNLKREFQDNIRQARADLKARIEAKRTQLVNSLKKVKDERKKTTVERIDSNMDALNARVTGHFADSLDKLSDILVRINDRTTNASSSVDISSVLAAIDAANVAITDARTAVEAQAGKTYTITVTSETGLKNDVGKARQALREDLKLVFEKVKAARDAVHEAARAYAKAHGRDLESPEPSPSPEVTVSPTATPTP